MWARARSRGRSRSSKGTPWPRPRARRRGSPPRCGGGGLSSGRTPAPDRPRWPAAALGACSVVNIKPGRVGGYLEARRVHDVCVANGIAVWAGGMLETGLGRAANVALAALPGFTLPGDTSASDRYFARDITTPFVLEDGHLRVPTGAGLGVEPDPAALADVTTATEWIPLPDVRSRY